MYALYNIILLIAALLAVPYYALKMMLTGKYRKSLGPKLGFNNPEIFRDMQGSPRIWIHAVSVGEVTAAAPVVASLRTCYPQSCIVLSTSTETGQEMARRLVGDSASLIYYPLDFPWVVRKVIHQVKPDIFVLTETELWPNFLRACKDQGVRVVMVNGRISPRSFKRYAVTKFFWKGILDLVEELGVISQIDAERLEVLGAPASKVHVVGNAKYDSLAAKASPELEEEISGALHIPAGDRVFVAGSTHEGEDSIVLDVYKRLLAHYPDCKLIIVPRHPERAQAVLSLAGQYGFDDCTLMSAIKSGRPRTAERVVIVDVIGELFRVYSLASVVFCGGSLVPKGGQNILEAAAWGKVICYGPFMDDFREERELLEQTGAGVTVGSGEELFVEIMKCMSDPRECMRRGEKGRAAVLENMGAAQRYAEMIARHIKGDRLLF
jgi:3-deoxy-D-manno-octulosonic-acid transferase